MTLCVEKYGFASKVNFSNVGLKESEILFIMQYSG